MWGARREELAFEHVNFSLSTDVPRPSDRRSDERMQAILPLARLSAGDWQDLGRVRNISAGGVSLETIGAPLPVDTELEVEFNSNQKVPGRIVWTRDRSIGVKFEENVDLRELLANRVTRNGFRPRPPRLEITCNATVRIDGFYHQVEVRDLALGGIKVRVNDWQCAGKPAIVTMDSFRPIKGTVRWFKNGFAGIVFDRPLSFEELAEWLGKRYEIAAVRTGAWDRSRH